MLIVVYFFLSFLGCSKAPKKVLRISLCDYLALLALLSLQLLQLHARLRKKAFFAAVHFCCHQPAAGVHVRIYLPAARVRRAGAAARAHAESFGGWGVLLC